MRLRADRRLGLLWGGVVLLVLATVAVTVLLPAVDPELGETSEHARAFGDLEERGMAVYRAEGCWYCHTQQVRDGAPADALYGEPLAPGDYAAQDPAMLGEVRVGPDLTHVGSRYDNAGELIALLTDPRAEGRRSTMPSYGYLSTDDLEALAAYLLALK